MSITKSPFVVTVGTSPTALVDPSVSGGRGVRVRGRRIRNLGASTVYLGGADVTANTTKGWALAVAGSDFPDTISNGTIYAIVASGTCDVQVWEVID